MFLDANNSNFQIRSDSGYESWTDTFTETKSTLRVAYGEDKLEARLPNGNRGPVNSLQEFFDGCYPSQVLDVVEAFLQYQDDKDSFTRSVNEMFVSDGPPRVATSADRRLSPKKPPPLPPTNCATLLLTANTTCPSMPANRSEDRRVGKEGRS